MWFSFDLGVGRIYIKPLKKKLFQSFPSKKIPKDYFISTESVFYLIKPLFSDYQDIRKGQGNSS